MKYIVILGDGMADYPVEQLGGKTPLEVAKKPHIDALCAAGEIGLVNHVPDSLSPGSDVANLSAFGYDPFTCYTGRSPLEAVSIGIDIKDTDMVFRCNVVTVSDEEPYEDKRIIDHSADEISTAEATELIKAVQEAFGNDTLTFYPGVSYRHALVWANCEEDFTLTPPHDILERRLGDYLPKGSGGALIEDITRRSYEILKNHPVNLARMERGLKPANSIWIWGEGRKPRIPSFREKWNLKGSVISAVDLIKGIALCAGMESIDVEGATGNVHTNFDGKAQACLDALERGADFVYIHMEAPDECGHRAEIENKVKSIELIDQKVVARLCDELDKKGVDYRMLVLPDHPTPLALRTHTRDAVPYIIYDSTDKKNGKATTYTEAQAKASGMVVAPGHLLMNRFLGRE